MAKIDDHWQFKLRYNSRLTYFKGFINGKQRGIIAIKKLNKSGEYTTLFMVTNFKDAPKLLLEIYEIRWNIEKLFRTSKPKLGFRIARLGRLFSKVYIFYLALQLLQ